MNCLDKVTNPELIGIGQSDHLGIQITKNTNEIKPYIKTTKKRIYKNFDKVLFIEDIKKSVRDGKFAQLFLTEDIKTAG